MNDFRPLDSSPLQSSPSLSHLFNSPVLQGSEQSLHKIILAQDWLENFAKDSEPAPNHLHAVTTLLDEIARLEAELARADSRRKELEHLLDTDPKCPALNHRAFERELTRAIALAKRSGQAGAVLFFDMNGLKALNDTHGHAAGDKAIERMAKTLVLASRQSDLVGRLGGDEFAVLLPHTTVEGALAQAARVQHLLQTLPLWLEEGKVSLTLSTAFGAAAFDGNSTATDVMQLADTHMYHHKKRTKAQ